MKKKSPSPERLDKTEKVEGLKSIESINKIIASRLNEKFGHTTDIDFNKININKILRINQEPLQEEETGPGVPVTEEDIEEFMKIINPYEPYIKKENIQGIIDAFPDFFTQKDLKLIMNGQSKLTKKDLYNMLKDNKLSNFDPIKETFEFLAKGKDYIDVKDLADVMKSLNFCEIMKSDLIILKKVADTDEDGKITIEDFRAIFDRIKQEKELEKQRLQKEIDEADAKEKEGS